MASWIHYFCPSLSSGGDYGRRATVWLQAISWYEVNERFGGDGPHLEHIGSRWISSSFVLQQTELENIFIKVPCTFLTAPGIYYMAEELF